jgi:hypothetical protein
MKRRITLSIALTLSVILLSLTSSDSTVKAQNQLKIIAETGLITLGPNQALRLTVNTGAGNDTIKIRFRRQEYTETETTGVIRKLAVTSQEISDPITLAPGEAASYNVNELALGRELGCFVYSDGNQNIHVNLHIINVVTGAFEMEVLRDW